MTPNRPPIPDPPHRGGCLCAHVARVDIAASPSALIPSGVPASEKGPTDRGELLTAFEKDYPR
jgi:hypothetical protein